MRCVSSLVKLIATMPLEIRTGALVAGFRVESFLGEGASTAPHRQAFSTTATTSKRNSVGGMCFTRSHLLFVCGKVRLEHHATHR